VNAQRVLRTRLATSAVKLVTSPGIAKTHLKKVLAVVVDSVVLVAQPKSATSAQRLVTLPATALRLVVTEVVTVETKAVTVAVKVDTVVETVDKLATLAVATVTCRAIALKVKNATTVVKLAISPATAQPKPLPNELATSASNLVTFKLNAPTKGTVHQWRRTKIHREQSSYSEKIIRPRAF